MGRKRAERNVIRERQKEGGKRRAHYTNRIEQFENCMYNIIYKLRRPHGIKTHSLVENVKVFFGIYME